MQPNNWNIVILGAWNRAILTPVWIQEQVLALSPGSPVDVMVPLDTVAPLFQVQDRGLTVMPAPGQLNFQLADPTPELLQRAMDSAKRAIEDLPRTPLTACGINLRYQASGAAGELLDNTKCKSEKLLSEQGYDIRVRRRGESLAFRSGNLNLIIDVPTTDTCTVTMNFDRQSPDRTAILDWLRTPASEYVEEANKIMKIIAGEEVSE